MDLYIFIVVLGAAGMAAMAFLGFAGGAAPSATSNITSVIQTVLAAQLVSSSGMLGQGEAAKDAVKDNGRQSPPPAVPTPPAKTGR